MRFALLVLFRISRIINYSRAILQFFPDIFYLVPRRPLLPYLSYGLAYSFGGHSFAPTNELSIR